MACYPINQVFQVWLLCWTQTGISLGTKRSIFSPFSPHSPEENERNSGIGETSTPTLARSYYSWTLDLLPSPWSVQRGRGAADGLAYFYNLERERLESSLPQVICWGLYESLFASPKGTHKNHTIFLLNIIKKVQEAGLAYQKQSGGIK